MFDTANQCLLGPRRRKAANANDALWPKCFAEIDQRGVACLEQSQLVTAGEFVQREVEGVAVGLCSNEAEWAVIEYGEARKELLRRYET